MDCEANTQIQGNDGDCGRSAVNKRLFVEAALGVAPAGSPRRDLPLKAVPWNSTHFRYALWADRTVWHNIFAVLREDADLKEGFIDGTILRAVLREDWICNAAPYRFVQPGFWLPIISNSLINSLSNSRNTLFYILSF
jgi:transposase